MKCCICDNDIPPGNKEHNALPVRNGKCCNYCNRNLVLPRRIKQYCY